MTEFFKIILIGFTVFHIVIIAMDGYNLVKTIKKRKLMKLRFVITICVIVFFIIFGKHIYISSLFVNPRGYYTCQMIYLINCMYLGNSDHSEIVMESILLLAFSVGNVIYGIFMFLAVTKI